MGVSFSGRFTAAVVSKGSLDATLAANLPTYHEVGDCYDISVAGSFENSALIIPASAYFDPPDQIRWNGTNWVKMESGNNVSDAAFDASWDGNVNNAPSKNAVYDEVIKKVNILDSTTAGFGFVIDEDNLVSNLDTKVPTQQSVKAYADAKVNDTAFAAGWDADTTIAPSKNAVYDEMILKMDKTSNLSDVDNIATSRANIDVYSKHEIHAQKSWTSWTIPASVMAGPTLCDYLETIKFTADEPFEMMITKQAGTPDGTKLYHYGLGLENSLSDTELANLLTDALSTLVPAPTGSFDSVTGTVDFIEGRSIKSQDLGDGSHQIWFTIRQAGMTDRYKVGQFTVATSTATFTLTEIKFSDLIADDGNEVFADELAPASASIEIDLTNIDDTAFAASWDGDTESAPSKNAVYDALNPHIASTTAHGISTFGSSLVDDADASTARSTLGLGSLATINNPMTTAGDLITGGVSGAPARLGIGTNGQVLTLAAGVPAWDGALLTVANADKLNQQDATKTVSTSTYTFLDTDHGKTLFFTYSGAVTITCPQSLTNTVHVTCVAEGSTTTLAFVAGSGATLVTKESLTAINTRYGAATLVHKGGNAWFGFGNLE